ncbi:MAG: O-antigen ligase family protein [Microbacterium gubbeenense]|uniref:O-antigen ligase family protein n=2 Tax=Microbacterium gubbeenense TaxID=159896 RepID=UPI003F9D8867
MSSDTSLAQRSRAELAPTRSDLPRWPITAMFAPFPLWWAFGTAEMMWIPLAGVMAVLLARRGDVRIPQGFGVWLLFLVMVAISVIGIDTPGRLIGFGLRAAQYVAVTVAFVYVFNARRTISPQWILGLLTIFWLYVVAGGFLGIAAPEFSFRTPLAFIVPSGLQSNELIQEMIVRRATQWNPDAWAVLDPRPSAPFLYTNGWGLAYSMLLPLVIEYAYRMRRDLRFAALIIALPISVVPAVFTLNRGMFLGLGVAAAYAIVRAMLAGRGRAFLGLIAVCGVGVACAVALGAADRVLGRVETSSSTEDRAHLYEETFLRTLESPLFGFGAPRPSWTEGAPSAGTQGHVWMVMFSHGFPALALFLAALAWFAWRTARAQHGRISAIHIVQVVLLVEVFYYGALPNGFMLAFLPAAAILPHDTPQERSS